MLFRERTERGNKRPCVGVDRRKAHAFARSECKSDIVTEFSSAARIGPALIVKIRLQHQFQAPVEALKNMLVGGGAAGFLAIAKKFRPASRRRFKR